MANVYMICGKICVGKSTYAKRLCEQHNAVLLSIDEITLALFGQHCGEQHDTYVERTEQYLLDKSLELLKTGVDVVLDWGCWTKKEREQYRAFYEGKGIPYELHYLDVPEDIWQKRIIKRNAAVLQDDSIAYYVDENLAKKFAGLFEKPEEFEVDVRVSGEDAIIQTERLSIRRVVSEDWQDIREIWVDFSASGYVQYDVPNDTAEDAVKDRIAKWAAFSMDNDHIFFAVCLHDKMIGYLSAHREHDSYDIGYCFHSAHHQNGYAKESILAVMAYLKTLGATKVTAGTALCNSPSIGLLRSLAFVKVGEEQVSFYQDENGAPIYFDGGLFEKML